MRAVQYIHAHVLEGIVAGEAAWRGGVGQQVEELEGSAGSVELVAGMGGEIEAEVLVAVENRGIDGAVEEREDGVGGRRDDGGLEVGHEEVMVGLEDGASGHGRVKDEHAAVVVIY